MVEHKCHKCHKIYTHKGDFERHLNKKNPCGIQLSIPQNRLSNVRVNALANTPNKSDDELQCQYCNIKVSKKSNLARHINNCKVRQESESDKDLLKKLLLEFELLKKENYEYKQKINILESNIANSQNISNYDIDKQQNVDKQINNINNNIKLIAFGNEDLNYIEDSIIKKILSKGFVSVPKLIEHVHFDKDKPEHHNVFISNIRTNKALTHDGSDWILRESSDVFDTLKANGCDFIDEKFKELKEKGELNESTIKKMKRFIEQRDDDDEQVKLNKEIEMLLYNKRKIVMNTKKKVEDSEKKQITH
jgi:DNA-directed RNA polymerase subunit RPC12/RpoP